jgi:glycosyltransferase involved in cell wall biosynthesis
MSLKQSSSLRILEIGEVSRMRHAFPNTEFYSTFIRDSASNKQAGIELVSAKTLIPLAQRLSKEPFDLVVVHASPHSLIEALIRTIFRRSALRGHLPIFRSFAQQLFRRKVNGPVAVLDLHDSPTILECNRHLLEASTLYFKRELPSDRWRLFSRGGKVPTFRYRLAHQSDKLSCIRPLSLGIPDNMLAFANHAPRPVSKDVDVFFAGRLHGSSTLRERGADELANLARAGFRVEITDKPMPPAEYFSRCARAWLVWSPEGYGWDCFRAYEAALAGSVPLVSRQTIERHKPFVDNEHCIYYDVEAGQLTQTIQRALSDRDRLLTMATAARDHVLRHHTSQALAEYVAQSTLAAAPTLGPKTITG